MKFLCIVYTDPAALEALPEGQFDTMMKECIAYDDELRAKGKFLQAEFLQPAKTAVTLRSRGGRMSRTDGPFAETKELLGGFQIIEARDMDEALEIAARIPWTTTGSIEVRPIGSVPTYD